MGGHFSRELQTQCTDMYVLLVVEAVGWILFACFFVCAVCDSINCYYSVFALGAGSLLVWFMLIAVCPFAVS